MRNAAGCSCDIRILLLQNTGMIAQQAFVLRVDQRLGRYRAGLNTMAHSAESSTSTLILFSTTSRRRNAFRRGSPGSAAAAPARNSLLVRPIRAIPSATDTMIAANPQITQSGTP